MERGLNDPARTAEEPNGFEGNTLGTHAPLELFRLAALRGAEPVASTRSRIVLDDNAASDAEALRTAEIGASTRPRHGSRSKLLGGLSDRREEHGSRGTGSGESPLELDRLDAILLGADDSLSPKAVSDWVKATTRQDVRTVVASEAFVALRRQVHGSLLALLAPDDDVRAVFAGPALAQGREEFLRGVRLLGLLELLAAPGTPPALADAAAVRWFLRASVIVLPSRLRRPADDLARPPVVADLKVVRLGRTRYEPGAIAHVENVMGRERRERVHSVTEQTETTTTVESERTVDTEQELETVSQTEMLQETSRALRDATEVEAGVAVSAAYGPTVQVEADARVARRTSSEEVVRAAAAFSNEVTKRARERVIERTRETRVVRRLMEVKETNTHAFDNSSGAGHIVGVYRWVESVQDAWMENYGKRLMLEYVIPEPGAFVRWAADRVRPDEDVGDPPPAPHKPGQPDVALEPGHVDATNYLGLVARYGAVGVVPPPAETVELALSWKGEPNQELHVFEESKSLKVPKGYRATGWEAQCVTWGSSSPDGEVWMAGVGATGGIGMDNSAALQKHLSGALNAAEESIIPVVMLGRGLLNLSTALRVHCEITEEGRARWRLAVYDAIMTAHRQHMDAYEARLERAEAARSFAPRAGLDGSNSAQNRVVERRELRRSVIHMLLGHPMDTGVFAGDAVVHDRDGAAPELDLAVAAAERDVLTFVEQAFEWANMTWVHYPYYWSTRDRWVEDCRSIGPDPAWTAFLTAGASRVVVPVRPGFEAGIALYLATGIVWAGGQVPTVDDPAYLAIADEIAESLGTRSPDAVSARTPLEPVRLPTSLVWLQPGGEIDGGG